MKETVNLFDRFIELLNALNREDVDYVLIGGYAVILHGLPRVTEDIDLFIRPDTDNVNRLKRSLLSVFDDESIGEITLVELERYPVIRYGSPDGFYIDLIVKIGDAFEYDDIEYEIRLIRNVPVRLATAASLYDMKKDTVRPVDHRDADFLRSLLEKKGGS